MTSKTAWRFAWPFASVLGVGLCLGLAGAPAQAALPTPDGGAFASAGQAPPAVDVHQHLSERLPLQLPLVDVSDGRVPLAHYFDGRRPVVLVLGYGRCESLCGLVMQSVLRALAAAGLRSTDYQVLNVSIDPSETVAMAAARRQGWGSSLEGRGQAVPLPRAAVGEAPALKAIIKAVGLDFQPWASSQRGNEARTGAPAQFAHAAGFVVATPQGRLSRYFLGLDIDPRALRLALVEASQGRMGTWADQVVLRCAHFDPRQGRYSVSVMVLARVVGISVAAAMAWWLWRHRQAAGGLGT